MSAVTDTQNSLGSLVKAFRENAGLTQSELATRASVSESYITAVETNRRGLGPDTLAAVMDALGLDSAGRSRLVAARKSKPKDPVIERLDRIEAAVEQIADTLRRLTEPMQPGGDGFGVRIQLASALDAMGASDSRLRDRVDVLEQRSAARDHDGTQQGTTPAR